MNDWGLTTTDEIIEGTGRFLDAHPFVDRDRVGCIGASYGGFMTMMLATKTDLFAAAISHAGISALTSYWGEGWWGVDYSSVATSGSYPWNRPDLYVEQSPLFHADRVTTPCCCCTGPPTPTCRWARASRCTRRCGCWANRSSSSAWTGRTTGS